MNELDEINKEIERREIEEEISRRESSKKKSLNDVASDFISETIPEPVKHAFNVDRGVLSGAATGLSNVGNNLANAASWFARQSGDEYLKDFGEKTKEVSPRPDFYKAVGSEDKPFYTPEGSAQLAGEMLPSGELGAGIGRLLGSSERTLPFIEKGVNFIKEGKYAPAISKSISQMLESGIAGGGMEAVGGKNPSVGSVAGVGLLGAALPPAIQAIIHGGHYAKNAFQNLPITLKNYILDKIEKSSEKGIANTPEATAQNVEKNFTNAEGERMPVDIGTATSHPGTRGIYDATEIFPFSGTSDKKNIIVNQKANLAIKNAETALADAEKMASEIRGESAADIEKQGRDINKMQADYNTIHSDHTALTGAVDEAPKLVNNLIADVPKDVSVPEYVGNETKKSYDSLRSEAGKDYKALDNMEVDFGGRTGSAETFPEYNQERLSLENESDKLTSMFGSDKDLPSAIRAEMESSKNLIEGKPIDEETSYESIGSPLSLKEIRSHISNLGKLWERAKNSGNDNAARMLMNMRRGLVNDTKNLLSETGNEEAVNLWDSANEKWAASADFWNTPEMRRIVGKKTTKGDYVASADKLAKELHNPNNAAVLERLPSSAQKAASHLVITGGKGATRHTRMTPDQIAKRVNSMTGEQHAVINQHTPGLGVYLSSLPDNISKSASLAKAKIDLAKQIDRIKLPNANRLERQLGNVGKRVAELDNLRNEKIQGKNLRSPMQRYVRNALGGAAGSAMIPALSHVMGPVAGLIGAGSLTARGIEKLLSNPEMIDKYIAKERFPKKVKGETPSLVNALSDYISRK